MKENIGVLVLIKYDAVSAAFRRSFNLLRQVSHWNQSSLRHDLIDMELRHRSLLNLLSNHGVNGFLNLLCLLLLSQWD